jgi:hypothetical protein
LLAGSLALVVVASASAAWGGKDPAHNTRIGRMPSFCRSAPNGKGCINAVVYYLDKARSRVHLPPYALPANFPSLPPPRQLFILVNLDRVQYGLRPFPGMTAQLSHDALVSGVWRADDPHPSHTTGLTAWWPGWAGAFYNAPMAYEVWVWDDGLGSTNPRCTPSDHSRCWGHRHSVLWKYGSVLAMGAAAGRDSRHRRGYAYLFVGGNAGYKPAYTYTWKQAVEEGAGTNTYDPGPPPSALCNVPVLIGLKLAGASQAIEKAHCSVGEVVRKHTHYVPGIVIGQHPAPGTTLARGAIIRLTVSLGPR